MTDTTTGPEHEYGAILAQVDALRIADGRSPVGVSLGPSQRASVQAYVQQLTGQAVAGPIVSIQSLPVVAGTDGVSLVFETVAEAVPVAAPAWPFIGEAPAPTPAPLTPAPVATPEPSVEPVPVPPSV